MVVSINDTTSNNKRTPVNSQLAQIKKYIETLHTNQDTHYLPTHYNNAGLRKSHIHTNTIIENNYASGRYYPARANTINTKSIFIDEALYFYNHLITEKPNLLIEDIKEHINYFISLDMNNRKHILSMFADIHSKNIAILEKPKLFKILESSLSIFHKKLVLYKLQTLETMSPSDSEYFKLSQWIDNILDIPFNTYKQPNYINTANTANTANNIDNMDTDTNTNTDIEMATDTTTTITPITVIASNKIFTDAREHLDKVIYGQNETKQHILEIIAKMISNPSSNGSVFAVEGAPGTGKTSLIKDGLSHALGLPFIFISLGGAQDASYLAGENYAYVGSKCGKIIQALKSVKCLNPIFYFDELDKVSNTPQGQEIINLLIHITDYSQNQHFLDYYMDGITVDLSHATFIFSFNDRHNICPILLDRMDIIHFKPYSISEKQYIIEHYLIPSIATQYFNNKYIIAFRDDIQKNIIFNNIINLNINVNINQTINTNTICWDFDNQQMPGHPITILLYTSSSSSSNSSSNSSINIPNMLPNMLPSNNTMSHQQPNIKKRHTIKFKSKYKNHCIKCRCQNICYKHKTPIYKHKRQGSLVKVKQNNLINYTGNTGNISLVASSSSAIGGVRYLKRQIEQIISKINIEILMKKT